LQADIKKITQLAQLELSEEQVVSFQKEFTEILNFFATIDGVDVQGVEPTLTPHQHYPLLREDKVEQNINVDEILKNAPSVQDRLFRVPPVV